MSQVEIRPSVAADFAEFVEVPFRVMSRTAVAGGEVLGVAGIGWQPDGTVVAFLNAKDALRAAYPFSLHRAALRFMAEIKARGDIHRIVALAEAQRPAAERWLYRLGFKAVETDLGKAYVWLL